MNYKKLAKTLKALGYPDHATYVLNKPYTTMQTQEDTDTYNITNKSPLYQQLDTIHWALAPASDHSWNDIYKILKKAHKRCTNT